MEVFSHGDHWRASGAGCAVREKRMAPSRVAWAERMRAVAPCAASRHRTDWIGWTAATARVWEAGFTYAMFGAVCVLVGLIVVIGVARGERGRARRSARVVAAFLTLLGALVYAALLIAGAIT
jgi:hypothetical protein